MYYIKKKKIKIMLASVFILISLVFSYTDGPFHMYSLEADRYVAVDQQPKEHGDMTIKLVKDPLRASILNLLSSEYKGTKITFDAGYKKGGVFAIAMPIVEGNEAYFTKVDDDYRTQWTVNADYGNNDLFNLRRMYKDKTENICLATQEECKLIKTNCDDKTDDATQFCFEPADKVGYCKDRYGKSFNPIKYTNTPVETIIRRPKPQSRTLDLPMDYGREAFEPNIVPKYMHPLTPGKPLDPPMDYGNEAYEPNIVPKYMHPLTSGKPLDPPMQYNRPVFEPDIVPQHRQPLTSEGTLDSILNKDNPNSEPEILTIIRRPLKSGGTLDPPTNYDRPVAEDGIVSKRWNY